MIMMMIIIMMSKVIPSPCQFTTYSMFERRQVVPYPSHFRSLYDRYDDDSGEEGDDDDDDDTAPYSSPSIKCLALSV